MEIKFDVEGLGISCQNPDQIVVNDSTNYVEAVFSFSGEPWDKIINKTAVFHQRKNKAYSVILEEGDRCYIPFEALKNCSFEVGIKASYEENNITKTIYTQRYKIKTSISCYSKDFDNHEVTPTQYDQIMALINSGGAGGGHSMSYDAETETLTIGGARYDEATETLIL